MAAQVTESAHIWPLSTTSPPVLANGSVNLRRLTFLPLRPHELIVASIFGARAVTRHGFSPDAYVQMAFQAAYYSLYGRVENTYEPAMTKAFLHGRTEAIRTDSRVSFPLLP